MCRQLSPDPLFLFFISDIYISTHLTLLRYVCRASLIPFVHEVPYKLSKTAIINRVFEKAPAALPALVNQLAQVDPKDLTDVMDYIQTLVPELDSRIVLGYTLTLCSAMTVSMHWLYALQLYYHVNYFV